MRATLFWNIQSHRLQLPDRTQSEMFACREAGQGVCLEWTCIWICNGGLNYVLFNLGYVYTCENRWESNGKEGPSVLSPLNGARDHGFENLRRKILQVMNALALEGKLPENGTEYHNQQANLKNSRLKGSVFTQSHFKFYFLQPNPCMQNVRFPPSINFKRKVPLVLVTNYYTRARIIITWFCQSVMPHSKTTGSI